MDNDASAIENASLLIPKETEEEEYQSGAGLIQCDWRFDEAAGKT